MNNNIELLAPAGSFESVKAAVNNGCDAIYIGGKNFNARHYASNFSDDDIEKIIDYCHLRGVKVFITLNILYKEKEIKDVLKFAEKMYKIGADAFIIQDIGLFSILKNYLPDIRFHASTQMTIHNLEGVNFLKDIGFDRVVLSRELSLNDIKYITENTSIEIETFVHGALCVCYSGRCLMSSLIGERSGNRGRCAQPCRLKYSLINDDKTLINDYLLSTKDIMTVDILDKLIESGIDSLKIEGRMKSPEYVALVTKTYRKYIDKTDSSNFNLEKNDVKELTQIFNRGGDSSKGYYNNWAGADMISKSPKSSGIKIGYVESYDKKSLKCRIKLLDNLYPGDGIEIWTQEPHVGTNISKSSSSGDTITITISGKIKKGDLVYKSFDKNLNSKLKKMAESELRKMTISASIDAQIEKPVSLNLEVNNISVKAYGDKISKAENYPITNEKLFQQISKTGNTPFKIIFKKDNNIDENIYIPVSSLNNLRREAISRLESELINSYKRNDADIKLENKEKTDIKINNHKISVQIQNIDLFENLIKYKIDRIYIEANQDNVKNVNYYIETAHKNNIELIYTLPIIMRDCFKEKYQNIIYDLEKSDIDGYLIRNYTKFKTNKKLIADYTFNVFNSLSVDFILKFFDSLTLSNELNLNELKELSNLNTEVLVYGKIPLMVTHQCPAGLYSGKKKSGIYCKLKHNKNRYFLKDRKNEEFPLITDCDNCVCSILNSKPLFVLNKFDSIKTISSEYFRLSFTDESKETAENILYSYLRFFNNESLDNKTENLISNIKESGYTTGHFFRGVL